MQEFLNLLGKTDVQEWLRGQQAPAAPAPAPAAKPGGRPLSISEASFGRAFSERLAAARAHLADLSHTVPRLGAEIGQAARTLRDASGGAGLSSIVVTLFLLAGLGFAAQAVVKGRIKPAARAAEVGEGNAGSRRRRWLGTSIVRELAGLAAFCAACLAPLLLLDHDPLSETILLSFLSACAAWVSARAVASLIAEAAEDDRSPECRAERNHVRFWAIAAVGWSALGGAVTEATRLTGMDPLATELVSYVLGLGLLAIGLIAIWRAPRMPHSPSGRPLRRRLACRWLATLFLAALWVLWVAGAMRLFWLLAIGVLLPVALAAARQLTRRLFLTGQDDGADTVASTSLVVVDTLLRAALIGVALWILAGAWEISLSHLAAMDDPVSKVTRALLTCLAILFAFDALWQFTRTAIDLKIAHVDERASPGQPPGVRQARLRTLLPVARNFAMVIFATLAVLMTLSAIGVEIGPLIASAGVVGLAIGFGAQTLVKDVISGVFYLLDDAFRVGEYIISGNYSGTVESFSLRSIRLRHPHGPVHTIPFSLIGVVQNISRDFAVDNLVVTVGYEADLEKARKLITEAGAQLMEDPELAPLIIEPLHMQAVSDFGTAGIQLKLQLTTKPGAQGTVRKKALPLIRKAFDDNGIQFSRLSADS